MKVREMMSTSVVSVRSSDTLQTAATRMKQADVGSLPVMEGKKLEGIITDRDIVMCGVAGGRHPSEMMVGECESKSVWSVAPEADVEEAARIMREHQIRRLPVVREDEVVGMLALADLARMEESRPLAKDVLSDISRPVAGARR
jgi:CBS domain-containing protein